MAHYCAPALSALLHVFVLSALIYSFHHSGPGVSASPQAFTIAVVTPDALPPTLRAMPDGIATANISQPLHALTQAASGGDDGVPLLNTVNAMATEALAAPRPLAQPLATAAPAPIPASDPMLLQSAAYNPAIFETNKPGNSDTQKTTTVTEAAASVPRPEVRYVAAPALWQKKQRQIAGLSVSIIQVSGVPTIDIRPYYDDDAELN